MDSPEMIVVAIINWILGIAALLCVISLCVFPLATIIAAIVEGQKQLAPGEVRRFKKTKIFGILSAVAVVGLIAILVLWGISVYVVSVGNF